MNKLYLVILLVSFSQFLNAQTYSGPESVEYDYANNRWLIANTQSHQVLSRDSTGTLSIFKSGLVSGPYGIEIVGDTLFCCCGNSIKGFRLSDTVQVFNLNIGATFLNGLTHDSNGNLYATDFTAKSIYKINISTLAFSAIATGLVQSPNGIIYDEYNNRCVFVNWGSNAPIKAINLDSNTVSTIITTAFSNCDGIARDVSGQYYVSNWGTQSVVRYDSSFLSPPVTIVSSLNNPADLFYNVVDDTLGIPNAQNNTVTFFGFSTVSLSEIESRQVSVFPNPVSEIIHIDMPTSLGVDEIEIFDGVGRLIESLKMKSNDQLLQFDVSNFEEGIYIVGFKTKNVTIIIKRFLKL